MKAVIMAGGKGTRLRPLTCDRPKPMVPMVGKPMMEHIIELLKGHGFADILATLWYMPQVIEDYFGSGERFGVNIRYFIEDRPLGTAGSVKNVERFLDDTFLVISGDALTDIDLSAVVRFHREKKSKATIVLTRVESPLEYGVVVTDGSGAIKRFLEKPSWGEVFSDTVNTGIYVLEPDVLSLFDPGTEFDFSKNLFPLMLARDMPMYGYVAEGYWCDVGNLEQYRMTHQDILSGKARVRIPGTEISPGVWVGEGAKVHRSARIAAPAFIGRNAEVKRNVEIGEFTVIGDGTFVNEGASLRRAVVWDGCYIGRHAELRGCVVGSRTSMKSQSAAYEDAVIGPGGFIDEMAVVGPGVKIWPGKSVEARAKVSDSMVWETRRGKHLFGYSGISGVVGVDMTPEFAAKLGAAYASCVGSGAVAVSSELGKAAPMVKRALVAGIASAGLDVFDVGFVTAPMARHAIVALGLSGGVHVKTSHRTAEGITVEFYDRSGLNVDKGFERKVENAFFGEDFKRASAAGVGNVAYVFRAADNYVKSLLRSVDVEAIRARGLSVVVGVDPDSVAAMVSALLQAAGCRVAMANIAGSEMYDELWGGGEDRPTQGAQITRGALRDPVGAVSAEVVRLGADLGILVDRGAERLILVDETGHALPSDRLLMIASAAGLARGDLSAVAAPVTAAETIAEVAQRHGAAVVWTKANPRALLEAVAKNAKPDVEPWRPGAGFDALAAIAAVLERLALDSTTLSQLVSGIPEAYMERRAVECPWEAKGRVMRSLIEEALSGSLGQVEMVDGIKIRRDDGWVLILPDSDEPVVHVVSQGVTPEAARALQEAFAARVQQHIGR